MCHFPESTEAERTQIREILNKTLEDMSEDESSPTHGHAELERPAAVGMAAVAY